MAAALECWSSRASTDEDMVEQVLMRDHDRSECASENNTASSSAAAETSVSALRESSSLHKRFQKIGRNVSESIASLKNTLSLDSPREAPASCRRNVWGSLVRSLTQLYPGIQLPEKLVSNLRKHYESLPFSYIQAGFEMKDVFLHIKMIEQASIEDRPAIMIHEVPGDDGNANGTVFKLTFACNSTLSWPAMCNESPRSTPRSGRMGFQIQKMVEGPKPEIVLKRTVITVAKALKLEEVPKMKHCVFIRK